MVYHPFAALMLIYECTGDLLRSVAGARSELAELQATQVRLTCCSSVRLLALIRVVDAQNASFQRAAASLAAVQTGQEQLGRGQREHRSAFGYPLIVADRAQRTSWRAWRRRRRSCSNCR